MPGGVDWVWVYSVYILAVKLTFLRTRSTEPAAYMHGVLYVNFCSILMYSIKLSSSECGELFCMFHQCVVMSHYNVFTKYIICLHKIFLLTWIISNERLMHVLHVSL